MERYGRQLLWAMVPMHLVLVAWVWFGRVLWGVGGWMFLAVMIALPFVLPALAVTSALALMGPERPRRMPATDAVLHVVLWAGLFACGLFMPDFGDTPDSAASFLTQVFGYSDTLFNASAVLALASAAIACLAWLVLFVLQVRRLARVRRANGVRRQSRVEP